jgi:hypothetical protein
MKDYRRPWWLLVNKSNGLNTTVDEEGEPGRRVFIIRGEPLVQGLAWLTWGPVGALAVIVVMTILAITLRAQEQTVAARAAFIVGFLGLPALVWVGTVILMTRLSARHLQAERQADRQECIIDLDLNREQLCYRTTAHPQEISLAFGDIQQVRTAFAIGETAGTAVRLVLDTSQGQVVLLTERLGTHAQKVDLAREIQAAISQRPAVKND